MAIVNVIAVVTATLYTSGILFEKAKKLRKSPITPATVPTVSGNQAQPQVQINNNQFNPEILTNKFSFFIFFLFVPLIVLSSLDYFEILEMNPEMLKKMTNLGLTQVIIQLCLSTYAYCTNKRLRKFVFEMHCPECFHI